MNKFLRAILCTIGIFAIILAIRYLIAKINGGAFNPDWATTAGLSVLGGVLSVFGPDAEQRKKNREALGNKFKGQEVKHQEAIKIWRFYRRGFHWSSWEFCTGG